MLLLSVIGFLIGSSTTTMKLGGERYVTEWCCLADGVTHCL